MLMLARRLSFLTALLAPAARSVVPRTPMRLPTPHTIRMLSSAVPGGERGAVGKRAARRNRRNQQGAAPPPAGAQQEAPADPEGLTALANRFARLEQPSKALELYDGHDDASEALPVVVRALLRMRRLDLALELCRRHETERPELPADTRSKCMVFLALCRAERLDEAAEMLRQVEVAHPVPAGALAPSVDTGGGEGGEGGAFSGPLWHAAGSVMVPGLVSALLDTGGEANVAAALRLSRRMPASPACVPPGPALGRLIRSFGKARCAPGVYACLDSFAASGQPLDADAMQLLVDALVHSVRFVKGGVSMGTLPTSRDMAELAFVGRSNVGKSSLVNMVLGRRAIAYTSKTPGKTQQYNYFALNEEGAIKHGGLAPFHVVDMPGLGYAKVPGAERKKWLEFIRTYAASRPQLRLLVHLVDGGVGPMKTDLSIMEMVKSAHAEAGAAGPVADAGAAADAGPAGAEAGGASRCPWEYVIVLTKADKCEPKALRKTLRALRRAVDDIGCPEPAAVVETSSRSKAGRDVMWRLMRGIVLPGGGSGADTHAQVALPGLPPSRP